MFWNLFKIEDNWVLFFDLFSKNNNGDSIRPIAEQLRKLHPEYKFFFVTKKKGKYKNKAIDMADEVLVEKSFRLKYILSKCKYVISSMGFPEGGRKKRGQIFVQVWHGSPIKKIYLSRDKNNPKYQKYVKQFRSTDIFCSQGNIQTKNLAKSFDLSPNCFLDSGYPRNDILFNYSQEFKDNLKKHLGLPKNKKVILYCPTWRRYDYKAVLPFDLNKMKQNLGNDYVLLLRSHVGKHVWVDENNHPVNIYDNEFSFNGSDYQEATHLYVVADMLITDYSSAVFDFALTRKPQILYVYDYDEYEKNFGLFYDYAKFSPFPVCKNETDLINAIKNYSVSKEDYEKFVQEYVEYEQGNAVEKILKKILEK